MSFSDIHWFELDSIYCAIRKELARRPDWRFGPERVFEVAKEGFDGFKNKIDIRGKVYCDLGCGTFHPFGISAVMYVNGAKETISLDLQPADEPRAAEALADLLSDIICFPKKWNWSSVSEAQLLERARQFDLKSLREGNLHQGIGNLPLRHIVTDIHNPIIPRNSIDVMTSRAVLEHFLDFETASKRFLEIMKPGGYAFHAIDIVDHRAYEDKNYHYWSFLREDQQWSDGVCNRLRSFQIKEILEKVGFDILDYNLIPGEPPTGFLNTISDYYKVMPESELKAIGVSCLLQKPMYLSLNNENLEIITNTSPGLDLVISPSTVSGA